MVSQKRDSHELRGEFRMCWWVQELVHQRGGYRSWWELAHRPETLSDGTIAFS